MIRITVWDEDMTAKYTLESLPTVLRILGTSIPGCIDLTSRICTMTNAKTVMSEGTGGWFNSRNGGRIRKSDEVLTKDEREAYLSDYRGSFKIGETGVIGI